LGTRIGIGQLLKLARLSMHDPNVSVKVAFLLKHLALNL
jgi:hypothetical protein